MSPTPVRPADRLGPGDQVGAWRVEARAAPGAMSHVFRARHVESGVIGALKLLRRPDDPEHTAFVKHRFAQEVQALERVDHPGAARLLERGTTRGGVPWLVLRWVEGRDLARVFREDQPDPHRLLMLVRQVAAAVAHAHANGVVHRDLKASNVLVDDEDRVTVIDFGLATVDAAEEPTVGLVVGSAHSMAPEQVAGRPSDARTDLYAIGVLLYRGLVGRYPFHSRQRAEILVAHLHRDVPPFARYRPELRVPVGLEDTVRRCLAKEPADRLASVDVLLAAIDAILARDDLDSAPPRTPVDMWVMALATAGVIALTVAVCR